MGCWGTLNFWGSYIRSFTASKEQRPLLVRKIQREPGMVVQTCNPSTWEAEASLVCRVSSRTVRTIQRNPEPLS